MWSYWFIESAKAMGNSINVCLTYPLGMDFSVPGAWSSQHPEVWLKKAKGFQPLCKIKSTIQTLTNPVYGQKNCVISRQKTWQQIKYPKTMTCLFKGISCTINVKYLTKQRCKKRSGTRRHHLLEWCNAITSKRSRTLTIHSSFLKHNDRITKYKCCYIPVIICTKTEKLPFSLRHDTIIQRVVTLTYEGKQLANFLPVKAPQRQRDIPIYVSLSIIISTLLNVYIAFFLNKSSKRAFITHGHV